MNIPRPEYPRPRLVRDKWINLNGEWQFEIDHTDTGVERKFWERDDFNSKIIVPFVPESKLSGIEYVDFMPAVWYKRTFSVPEEWKNGRVILHFGAVDYKCEVWINGKSLGLDPGGYKNFAYDGALRGINGKTVGCHIGGYTPFEYDITSKLVDGDNTVVVYAADDTRNRLQPSGKQSDRYYNYGCLYTRCTGIWQTVWLEYVPKTYVQKLKLTPDVDNKKLDVVLSLNERYEGTVKVKALYDGRVVSYKEIKNAAKYSEFSLPIEEMHLWFPDSPELYDLEIEVGEDTVKSYFGMRKVAIKGYAIEINDKPIYQRLVLDQGYYPDGIYTAPTDEDLKRDIELSKKVGFNGARLHMKVFEPRLSYWTDKLGYLLWGEYPNWGLDEGDPAAMLSMLPEWLEAVERDYNSPAIIGWCPFNETRVSRKAQTFITVYNVTRAIDPMRPIIDSSGYVHAKTDIYDVHNYEQDPEKFKATFMPLITGEGEVFVNHRGHEFYEGQPYFVSEFGGTHWDIDADGTVGWGYGKAPEDIEEVYRRFEGLVTTLLENPKMCAFCYTQLTDVMQEKNGIYSFDRREKFDAERLYKIMTKKAAIEK